MAILDTFRFANSNVGVSDEHVRVNITVHCSVGAENGLQLSIDKEVVGVDMLFHQTLDFEESRQKVPFVLVWSALRPYQSLENGKITHPCCVDGIGQAFAVVERFK